VHDDLSALLELDVSSCINCAASEVPYQCSISVGTSKVSVSHFSNLNPSTFSLTTHAPFHFLNSLASQGTKSTLSCSLLTLTMVRRKSLLIGINYTGSQHELRGCHRDIENAAEFLSYMSYSDDPRSQVILRDDMEDPYYPSGHNMLMSFYFEKPPSVFYATLPLPPLSSSCFRSSFY
jgi:hypothetical protein